MLEPPNEYAKTSRCFTGPAKETGSKERKDKVVKERFFIINRIDIEIFDTNLMR